MQRIKLICLCKHINRINQKNACLHFYKFFTNSCFKLLLNFFSAGIVNYCLLSLPFWSHFRIDQLHGNKVKTLPNKHFKKEDLTHGKQARRSARNISKILYKHYIKKLMWFYITGDNRGHVTEISPIFKVYWPKNLIFSCLTVRISDVNLTNP